MIINLFNKVAHHDSLMQIRSASKIPIVLCMITRSRTVWSNWHFMESVLKCRCFFLVRFNHWEKAQLCCKVTWRRRFLLNHVPEPQMAWRWSSPRWPHLLPVLPEEEKHRRMLFNVYRWPIVLRRHCLYHKCTFTFTFRAFSRRFYPKRLTISTFVIRSETIYHCRYSKDVHRTKCKY